MEVTITRLKGKGWVQGLALAPDGTLWAVSYRDNLLRSADLGDTWEAVSSPAKKWLTVVAVTPDGAVLVGDEKGALHESTDLGQTWEHTPLRGVALARRGRDLGDHGRVCSGRPHPRGDRAG